VTLCDFCDLPMRPLLFFAKLFSLRTSIEKIGKSQTARKVNQAGCTSVNMPMQPNASMQINPPQEKHIVWLRCAGLMW
jgi:hypothetical protein